MALASWNVAMNEGDHAFAHELQGPEPANDVLRLRHPRYMLLAHYDQLLRLSVARLHLMTVPREGWRLLDEAVIAGDDVPAAVAKMREARWQARAIARGVW